MKRTDRRDALTRRSVAVIGAGLAGISLARRLAQAGHSVQLFDKSRGVGGRMATRRAAWVDADGISRITAFDHGAPAFTAASPQFAAFSDAARDDGVLAAWSPRMDPRGDRPESGSPLWVPVPDSPALCRRLAGELPRRLGLTIDTLIHDGHRWQLAASGAIIGAGFDRIVLALPPAQAALLLAPHRRDWARQAALAPMQPCWTLMGVTDEPTPAPAWEAARPRGGLLDWILRVDRRPQRERVDGEAHWVVHASPAWSRQQVEATPEEVTPWLQQALAEWVGVPLRWRHAVVHRWRYARPVPGRSHGGEPCWWDRSMGLGVCGDLFAAGPAGADVEGAWISAHRLADRMQSSA